MLKPYNRAELAFDLKNEIGAEGKNSKVFLAWDHQLSADLVIKQIPKSTFADRDQYFKESSILYLSNHPFVVSINYACEDSDYVYLAMPYYSKGSLNKLINTRFLTVREIIRYSTQFLSGLHNIHSKGLIHFDIKPDNILISDQEEALLSDFGLAKQTIFSGVASQDLLYGKITPPERFSNPNSTSVFDIYQIGVTLYRMCVGNIEFYNQYNSYSSGGSFDRDRFKFDVTNGRFPNRDKFPEHIPTRLAAVVKNCLHTNPTLRTSSAIKIVNELADIDGNDLDWQYSIDSLGTKKWTKNTENGMSYQLEVDNNNKSKARTINLSGTPRMINEYCLDNINYRKIRSFLGNY